MNYEEYKEKLIEAIKDRLGEQVSIEDVPCIKNNEAKRDGFVIRSERMANPIFYIDAFYTRFCSGEDINEQIEMMFNILSNENVEVEKMANKLLQGTWEEIKANVGVEVINHNWNKTKLEDVPHARLLNLAIVFRVLFDDNSSSIITNAMMKRWKITETELMQAAFNNLRETKFNIKKVADVLGPEVKEELTSDELEECPLYVMSNESQVFGASGLVRKDLLKEFVHKIGKDVFVLPSSIHEILLVPATDDVDVTYLKSMVKCVNESSVNKAEWLSENVYYFGRDKAELEMAA